MDGGIFDNQPLGLAVKAMRFVTRTEGGALAVTEKPPIDVDFALKARYFLDPRATAFPSEHDARPDERPAGVVDMLALLAGMYESTAASTLLSCRAARPAARRPDVCPADLELQLRLGLRAGLQFSTSDRFTTRACDFADESASCGSSSPSSTSRASPRVETASSRCARHSASRSTAAERGDDAGDVLPLGSAAWVVPGPEILLFAPSAQRFARPDANGVVGNGYDPLASPRRGSETSRAWPLLTEQHAGLGCDRYDVSSS